MDQKTKILATDASGLIFVNDDVETVVVDETGNISLVNSNGITAEGAIDFLNATSVQVPTPLDVSSNAAATTGYVKTIISNLIDNAPENLNTLNELAAALQDNSENDLSNVAVLTLSLIHI